MNNTSRNHRTTLGTIAELSRKYSINYGTLTNRINRARMNISDAVVIGSKYHYKPIVQYDREGNYINEYDSLNAAAKAVCTNGHFYSARTYISKCCNGKIKLYRGYKFEFKPKMEE